MKAQVQLGEAITVVILLVILIVVGLCFWAYVSEQSLRHEFDDAADLDLIELTVRAATRPQLACTVKGERIAACYDLAKARAVQAMLADAQTDDPGLFYYYQSVFGASTVELVQIYPPPDPASEPLILWDADPGDAEGRDVRRIPLLLQGLGAPDTFKLGLLTVTRYR